jgi:hypothetical protein
MMRMMMKEEEEEDRALLLSSPFFHPFQAMDACGGHRDPVTGGYGRASMPHCLEAWEGGRRQIRRLDEPPCPQGADAAQAG